ncbi:M24 family metallopeptidase [Microbacterium gubbeenense]|uniref:M24 family metallopeptidase n=1 Tax=Microbacterium gubbeenense TaxID=159896 RepID=UPI003F9D7B2F
MSLFVGTTTDREQKLARVRQVLVTNDARAVHLTSNAALSWLLDGARIAVPLGGAPVLSATVTRDGEVTVTALANEVERLAAEEIADVAWRTIPWHASLAEHADDVAPESAFDAELRAARAQLLPVEVERYRALGSDTARAVSQILREADPAWTERELAARLARAAYEIGAEPAVVLAAGESRGFVQHPIPTDAPLGNRAMAVLTTVRHGLHASMSRWVEFGPGSGFASTEERLREVEADVFAATRPGAELADVFAEIPRAYARHGFGDEAWTMHHQGGPTGYAGRDPKASPGIPGRVAESQAFAWNPWVPGAKLEDTVLACSGGIEVLTHDPAWPSTTVRGLPRPLPLARY